MPAPELLTDEAVVWYIDLHFPDYGFKVASEARSALAAMVQHVYLNGFEKGTLFAPIITWDGVQEGFEVTDVKESISSQGREQW